MGCAERQWGFVLLHWNSWRIKSHPKLPEPTHAFFLISVDPGFSCHAHLLPGKQGNILLPVCSHTWGYLEQVCCVWLKTQRQHMLSLSETCFSCSEGYSGYLCIISWAGFVSFEETPPASLLSLFKVIHHYLHFFFIHLFLPTSSCSNLSGSLSLNLGLLRRLQILISMCYWIFWLWSRSQPVSQWLFFALGTTKLISALMHLLKPWLFIYFLYTIFRYTPEPGNDQSCFLHVALLFLFSYISMENHGVGTGLTSGNQCFQPIYLCELSFWIIFSAFLMKTLKLPWSFFVFLPDSQKYSKNFPFTDLTSSYLSVLSTCRHKVRS